MSGFCSQATVDEPLAGTAPTQTHWLFVEAPGAWGRQALAECSLPASDRAALSALPPHWRVVLVRRPDRPLRRLRDRFVWLSRPEGPPLQWRLAVGASPAPNALGPGEPIDGPVLFICTNGGRDRCCALHGRKLFDALADDRAWECSHLGGHRFAPTAVRLPDRMVFGRLTHAAARGIMQGEPGAEHLRGPAGFPVEVQAAAASVCRTHGSAQVRSADAQGGAVHVTLVDGSSWQVPIRHIPVSERLLSCGAEPRSDVVVLAEAPVRVG